MPLHLEEISLREVVLEVTQQIEPMVRKKQLDVRDRRRRRWHGRLHRSHEDQADAAQPVVERGEVHAPGGSPSSATRSDGGVRIDVIDTGIGIRQSSTSRRSGRISGRSISRGRASSAVRDSGSASRESCSSGSAATCRSKAHTVSVRRSPCGFLFVSRPPWTRGWANRRERPSPAEKEDRLFAIRFECGPQLRSEGQRVERLRKACGRPERHGSSHLLLLRLRREEDHRDRCRRRVVLELGDRSRSHPTPASCRRARTHRSATVTHAAGALRRTTRSRRRGLDRWKAQAPGSFGDRAHCRRKEASSVRLKMG